MFFDSRGCAEDYLTKCIFFTTNLALVRACYRKVPDYISPQRHNEFKSVSDGARHKCTCEGLPVFHRIGKDLVYFTTGVQRKGKVTSRVANKPN